MSRDQSTHNVCLAYCIPQNSIYIKLSREQKPNSHCCSSLEMWYETKKTGGYPAQKNARHITINKRTQECNGI